MCQPTEVSLRREGADLLLELASIKLLPPLIHEGVREQGRNSATLRPIPSLCWSLLQACTCFSQTTWNTGFNHAGSLEHTAWWRTEMGRQERSKVSEGFRC